MPSLWKIFSTENMRIFPKTVARRLDYQNKPGAAQVGAISNSQFNVENRKSKKNGPSGAPRPASASSWRAKRGTLPKLSTFLSQLKGDPLQKKQIFEKKVSQCRKTERGSLWDF